LAGRAARISVRQYEAERCVAHNEEMAADLALSEGLREVFHFLCLINKRYAPMDKWLPWMVRRLPVLANDILRLVNSIRETADARRRLSLFTDIVNLCASYVYDNGLAARAKHWWADLRQAITGELRDFPHVHWIGVEDRYASQFALGGDFRRLLEAQMQ